MATRRRKLSKPMPRMARPIAEILRRDVRRPAARRFFYKDDMWRTFQWECPMGLHPAAETAHPVGRWGFPPAQRAEQVLSFGKWWDRLPKDELVPALDAIWGKKRKRRK